MKSKMLSDVSSKSGQPKKLVLFLDRNLGRNIIPDILRKSSSIIVEIHDDHFPPDARDEDILEAMGKRGWIFLTKDKRIRYNAPAQIAIEKAQVKMFYLSTRGDLQGKEIAEIIVKALPGVIKYCEKNKPPFIAKIMRDGKIF